MSIVAWVILGAVMGFLANVLIPRQFPYGVTGTVVGGTVGAFLAGAVFSVLSNRGVGGLDPVTLPIAFLGAVAALLLIRRVGFAEPEAQRTP